MQKNLAALIEAHILIRHKHNHYEVSGAGIVGFCQRSSTSEKTSTLIKSLVADGVIQPSGSSRKFAKYVLSENFREKIFG